MASTQQIQGAPDGELGSLRGEIPQPYRTKGSTGGCPPNTRATNHFWFVASVIAVRRTAQVWAKGDLNPHVPKDTGT